MLEIQKFSKIIAANWKMNGSIKFVENFLKKIVLNDKYKGTTCNIICPPFAYIHYTNSNLHNFYIGGQDCSIFHEGACSTTTEWNGKYIMEKNFKFSKDLFDNCQSKKIKLIYASSASVYGSKNKDFTEKFTNEIFISKFLGAEALFSKSAIFPLNFPLSILF